MRLGVAVFGIMLAWPARADDGSSLFTLPSSPTTAPVAASEESEPAQPDLPEPPAPPFGARGQLVVRTSAALDLGYTEYPSGASFFEINAQPAIDWFVVRNISVGVGADVDYADSKGFGADGSLVHTLQTFVSGEIRFGSNAPIHRWASFYPNVGFGIESVRRDLSLVSGGTLSTASPVASPSTTSTGPYVDLYAPILFHPWQHFFVGAGPFLFHSFGRVTGGPDVGAERTLIGARTTVGVHWGGAAPPRASDEPTRARRFGDHHDIVITGESSLSVNWRTYQGTDSSQIALGISPAVDVFVGHRVALGATVAFSYFDLHGVDAMTHANVTYQRATFSAGPRLAVDLPLASWLSVYPRARILFGYQNDDERSGSAKNASSSAVVNVGIFVPLLVHLAPHAFVGLGPLANYDLVRHTNFGKDNQAWTVGASWIVGGWI